MLQPTPISLSFNPSLKSYEQRNIFLDSFIVTQNYDVVVWVESVNNQSDTINWNDTASISYVVVPLAEFVAPFVADTINQMTFNVYVNIYEGTGAPVVSPPKMYLHTIVSGTQHLYDTITMVRNGSNWVAIVLPQYFDSKVIYSLFVSDTMGNSIILEDSTYIQFDAGSRDFNLSLSSLISPVNDPNALCDLFVSPVEVLIVNSGGYDYDFTKDNLLLGCEVTDPSQTYTVYTSLISTGTLQSGRSAVFEILPSLPLTMGVTDIKVWISSSRDTYYSDDTLTSAYTSRKLGFPVEEDFSDPYLPPDFTSIGDNTNDKWEVIHGGDATVVPLTGTGMIRFSGSLGAVSKLYVKQIDIYNALQPTLTFWYFHDTVPSNDYTLVKVVLDGDMNGGEFLQLVTKQDAVYGWKQYDIGLAKYTQEPCVVIVFETMSYTEVQYIDRIYLHATQNLSLDTILVPNIALCDFDNKDILVVISNPSAQSIDFKNFPTRIDLQINSQNVASYALDTGVLHSQTRDTITLTTMSFVSGTTYNLAAVVAIPIDPQPSDDIARKTLVINPDVAVTAIPNTNWENCFPINSQSTQMLTIRNKGNFDVYNLPLVLEVHGGMGLQQSYSDTLRELLPAGASKQNYVFAHPYNVPMEEQYSVVVRAELSCDAYIADNFHNLPECVDFDIAVLDILKPDSECEKPGDSINITAKISNKSPYPTAVLHAQILNGNNILTTFTETINIPIDKVIEYTFPKPYVVPSIKNYTMKVFISKLDERTSNDTVTKLRTTDLKTIDYDVKRFVLGQNIPNPAQYNTRIEYNIPEDGQVIFTVYTITGQTLYTEKKDAYAGKNEMEFNTISFANGIYYYAMEYKGERLVKKMTIRK